MKRFRALTIALFLFALPAAGIAQEKPLPKPQHPLELRDGERVTLLGGTFIERMQSYGYLEALLTAAHPNRNITFRNLGWSGDNVWGDSRAVFGQREDGFKRLLKDVQLTQPTMIVVAYGGNEAFEGKSGLEPFRKGLQRLLTELTKATSARLVLLSPLYHEGLGPPLPKPDAYNANAALYRDVISAEAEHFQAAFIDASDFVGPRPKDQPPLTTNGMHLNDAGYWHVARQLSKHFTPPPGAWFVGVDVNTQQTRSDAAKLKDIRFAGNAVGFVINDKVVSVRPQAKSAAASRVLRIAGLSAGDYALKVDGKVILTADADAWKKGVELCDVPCPEYQQAALLRQTIAAKNELFFYRYRPQNETYLFLFRKHEQGNNAGEIPQFDPLIETKEKDIAKLRVPQPHTFEIIKSEE